MICEKAGRSHVLRVAGRLGRLELFENELGQGVALVGLAHDQGYAHPQHFENPAMARFQRFELLEAAFTALSCEIVSRNLVSGGRIHVTMTLVDLCLEYNY